MIELDTKRGGRGNLSCGTTIDWRWGKQPAVLARVEGVMRSTILGDLLLSS